LTTLPLSVSVIDQSILCIPLSRSSVLITTLWINNYNKIIIIIIIIMINNYNKIIIIMIIIIIIINISV
jgi:hypothetical protein